MNKRKIVLIFAIMLMASCVTAFGYNFPNEFWKLDESYQKARSCDDYEGIVKYGNKIIDLMKTADEGPEKNEIIVSRYEEIGFAKIALDDYDGAADAFQSLYDYAIKFGDVYADFYKGAQARVLQYRSNVRMYTDGGVSPYYGAVNEKGNGVLFGMCADGDTRSKLDNESMVLVYQEFGEEILGTTVHTLKIADENNLAVEFALNCPNEAYDIRKFDNKKGYLEEISDLFYEYPDVPIYLRFAAEFNVWDPLPDASDFKAAFRYVSNYFKQRHDNVAIVWSPNQTSNWDISMHDYYPGDRYVDWVGVSLYAQKYFRGEKNAKDIDNIIAKTGINSNPIIAMRELIETYGDRKPIMISESGCGHTIMKTGEDTSDFAIQRLKEYYNYLPMVYPQIKLMAYFDNYVDNSNEKDDFRLSSNRNLQKEYLKIVKGKRFVQDSYWGETDYCNRPIYNGIELDNIFELSCYAHSYDATIEAVTYFIDGKYVGMSTELPYTTMIDAREYGGKHKLKANVKFDNGKVQSTESEVYIENTSAKEISVEISDKRIKFDQEPIAYNNRTMVPMRKIFEELGAEVSWDGDTSTAIGVRGGRTVEITVGQKKMYVNGECIDLDTAPIALSGRVLVPARAVAEGLGCTVDWDGKNNIVIITPKKSEWSSWSQSLPDSISNNKYYIDEKNEYRYRTREKEYFTMDYEFQTSNYVRTDVSYGNWSSWSTDRVSENENREVQTRTVSQSKKYLYGHYCVGNDPDESIRYMTDDYNFTPECTYHELGWFDEKLPVAPGGKGYILYKDNGDEYRCKNTCFRWYILDTKGGDYTEYRYRTINKEHIYWQWGDWSRWSSWDEENPYDYYSGSSNSIAVEERTLYRYKEK